MFRQTTVGDPTNAATVPAQGTGSGETVPAGTGQGGSADAGESLDDLRAKLDQAELDRRGQQAAFDRRFEQEKRRWSENSQTLQKRLDELATAGMDEVQRTKYEAARALEEANNLRHQLEEIQQSQAQQQALNQWRDYYIQEFGVSPTELDMTSQEALVASGMTAIKNRLAGAATPQRPSSVQTPAPTAPRVLTGQGTAPQVRVTFEDVRASLSKQTGRPLSDEEIYALNERGAIDLGGLLGLSSK